MLSLGLESQNRNHQGKDLMLADDAGEEEGGGGGQPETMS